MGTKRYGTVSPEQLKAMSGLEFVTGLASGVLPLNTMAQTLGYDVGCHHPNIATTRHATKVVIWIPKCAQYATGETSR